MAYFYFDETIRERGEFIIGALVASQTDLSTVISNQWRGLGLDPNSSEYKSSDLKKNNATGRQQRQIVSDLLFRSRLALTVLPVKNRLQLGQYCVDLVLQLYQTGFLEPEEHHLFLDQNIKLSCAGREQLNELNVLVYPDSDSREIGGIQIADHAAHALGGMLLDKMGFISKKVRAGENSGFHPDDLFDLGFELWASLRHALIGKNEYIKGLSPHPDDPANPFFRVDGVGLYIAPTCSDGLSQYARECFGINYLGCIH